MHHFVAPVPTYVGSFMVLSFSSPSPYDKKPARPFILEKLQYYTEALHTAAFALPQYILNSL